MRKVLRMLSVTAVAAVAGFTMAVAPGCSTKPTTPADGGGSVCTPGDVATQEANCHCKAKTDCALGNSAKWACTPAHACIQICTSAADCGTGEVCEDLICRPPGCGSDTECNSGQQCVGGACKPAVSSVASCAIAPPNAVINAAGKKTFWVIGYDSTGAAVPYKGTVTWGSTVTGVATTDTGLTATFASTVTASATGTVTASIGSTTCTAATLTAFGPSASGVRVNVVSEGASQALSEDEAPIANATVVLDDTTQTTDANGSTTFAVAAGTHTISVFAANHSYVTIVNTSATDILVPVKAKPNVGSFTGQLKASDFDNVSNPNGTLHLDISGASIGGNLIDLSLASLLGPSQPVSISLGTGTPYGPFNLPEGIALGLGAQMFGPPEPTGGQYGAVAAPGYRALWSIGGNAVIGDVLKAIGPVLNGGGGSITDQIPTILTAMLPILGSLESAVTSGIKVTPGETATLSTGGAQPSLKLDTLQRIRYTAKTPALPSYVNDAGNTAFYDGAIIIGGSLASPQGLIPLGLTAAIDQGGPGGAMVPDHITDAIGTGAAGTVPLRVAPKHGGIEGSKWAFITLGASIKDLVGGFGAASTPKQGIVLSGNVSLYQKGTMTPYDLKYTAPPAAAPSLDLSDDFLGVPNVPTIADRTVTLAGDVSGAAFYRLDVGADDKQWAIYYPAGTTTVTVPAVPSGFDDRWAVTATSNPGINLQTVSLGYAIPGTATTANPEGTKATWDSVWQFDGVDAADLTQEIDKFSLRALPDRPAPTP